MSVGFTYSGSGIARWCQDDWGWSALGQGQWKLRFMTLALTRTLGSPRRLIP